jgi:cell division protein FtsN
MGHTKVPQRGVRSPWPTALLVIATVAAASVALGLTVVGPMLQRRLETPPPALALNTPAPTAPVETARAEADVQIKERVIPRPKPKPPPELNMPLTVPAQTVDEPGTTAGTTVEASRTSPRPSIRATISDTDPNGLAERGRDSARGEPMDGGDGSERQVEGARGRDNEASRTRRRRLSPLEALPTLGSSLPRGPASEREPKGAAAESDSRSGTGAAEATRDGQGAEKDGRRTGRSYRVQVGRFADETDARRLRDELAGSGLSPRVVRTERDGVVLYRVQVGTFKMKENADRQVGQLKEQRYEPYIADEEP